MTNTKNSWIIKKGGLKLLSIQWGALSLYLIVIRHLFWEWAGMNIHEAGSINQGRQQELWYLSQHSKLSSLFENALEYRSKLFEPVVSVPFLSIYFVAFRVATSLSIRLSITCRFQRGKNWFIPWDVLFDVMGYSMKAGFLSCFYSCYAFVRFILSCLLTNMYTIYT